jgi:hypothetical protein
MQKIVKMIHAKLPEGDPAHPNAMSSHEVEQRLSTLLPALRTIGAGCVLIAEGKWVDGKGQEVRTPISCRFTGRAIRLRDGGRQIYPDTSWLAAAAARTWSLHAENPRLRIEATLPEES